MLFFDCLGETREKNLEGSELEVEPITLSLPELAHKSFVQQLPGPEMFKMSTFSLVFIKSDHGVLSI